MVNPEWEKAVGKMGWGTTAIHKIGDISRPDGDYFIARKYEDGYFIGEWVTGFGFIDVKFPEETTRELTEGEREWILNAGPPVIT